MVTLEFIPQTGKISQAIKLTPSAVNDKAGLTTAINEAESYGRTLELIAHEHDNDDNAFIKSVTFGLSADSREEDITAAVSYPFFFASGRFYTHVIVTNETNAACQISLGTTAGGFELATSEAVSALETKAIPLNGSTGLVTTAVTPLYIHVAGSGDDFNGCTLNIKTVSEAV